MGHRALKRVPLDFDWPLNEVWKGYINPHYKVCDACDGSGSTSAMKYLNSIVHLILIAGDNGLAGRCHPWLRELATAPKENPSVDMAEISQGLAGRGPGHDAIDRWNATKKIIQAAGLDPKKWGICTKCQGGGVDPIVKAAYEAWEEEEPPSGPGYQLWETVSEGSPISPVFESVESLAEWCEKNATVFASEKTTYERWLKMFQTQGGAETGSMFLFKDGYLGSEINMPK